MFNFVTLSGEIDFEVKSELYIEKVVKILQTELDSLQAKYNIEGLRVTFDFNLDTNIVGKSDATKKRILLNPYLINEDGGGTIMQGLYHEFRHYWQFINYEELYRWWLCQQNREVYRKFYFYKLCAIEEDARVFGLSFGAKNRQDLLEWFTATDLARMKKENQLDMAAEFLETMQ